MFGICMHDRSVCRGELQYSEESAKQLLYVCGRKKKLNVNKCHIMFFSFAVFLFHRLKNQGIFTILFTPNVLILRLSVKLIFTH